MLNVQHSIAAGTDCAYDPASTLWAAMNFDYDIAIIG
jgi:hypothetical protein